MRDSAAIHTREELRKHIRFICDLVAATDKYLEEKI